MKLKTILIASTLATSGLLGGCDLTQSTDPVRSSPDIKAQEAIIRDIPIEGGDE